jgi:FKBP-type peptidyl-prolyl cis-trans isomerase FklB
MDKVSYALGMSIGQNMISAGIDNIEFDDFLKGVKVIFNETKPEISVEYGNQILQTYFEKKKKEEEKRQKEESEKRLQEGKEFLKKNSGDDGVQVTASGLQYKVISKGDGQQPGPHGRVKCHYEGRFIDGQVFDSSYKRGEPTVFGLDQVIPGWTEGLQLMNVGSKYEFYIPGDLGYGERGIPGHIPGNTVLIFTVELLSIE